MLHEQVFSFTAALDCIGVNPFVFVPDDILLQVFEAAGKSKGPVPVRGTVNGKPYTQTLVKFAGYWRLYINLSMLDKSPSRIGEQIHITIAYDPVPRVFPVPALFKAALDKNPEANTVFQNLPASRRLEMLRYFSFLKTEATLEKNVARAIRFLLGQERFMGREKP
jgi:hypothetical protein